MHFAGVSSHSYYNCKSCVGRVSFIVIATVLCFACATLITAAKSHEDVFSNSKAAGAVKEFCTWIESFEARCPENEVIVMTSAVYGRMRIGRCLTNSIFLEAFKDDPKFWGCFVDILQIMDRKCSGLNHCIVLGALDDDLRELHPCHEELKSYLEASYNCVPVLGDDSDCTMSVTSTEVYLVSSAPSTTTQSCGSRQQPWKLKAPAGQQINVSLLDFGVTADFGIIGVADCLEYGYITDPVTNKNKPLCATINRRELVVYSSNSNKLEIIFQWAFVLERYSTNRKILVGFKAVGCLNIIPPEDAWMRREAEETVIGCYTSRRVWYLRCVDEQWTGVMGDCSIEVPEFSTTAAAQITSALNYNEVSLILIIISLTAILCTAIICTAAVCLKRYSAITLKKKFADYERTYNKSYQNLTETSHNSIRENQTLNREIQPLTAENQILNGGNQNSNEDQSLPVAVHEDQRCITVTNDHKL